MAANSAAVKTGAQPGLTIGFGTPGMAYDLWGASPLYESENL